MTRMTSKQLKKIAKRLRLADKIITTILDEFDKLDTVDVEYDKAIYMASNSIRDAIEIIY